MATKVNLPQYSPRPIAIGDTPKGLERKVKRCQSHSEVAELVHDLSYMDLRSLCYDMGLNPLGTREEMFRRICFNVGV